MANTIMDILFPTPAEVNGTQRVDRIATEPIDQQIRDSGLSVLDAMLVAAKDQVVALAAGTQVGQSLIAQARQQQVQQYQPLIVIGLLVAAVIVGAMFFGRR